MALIRQANAATMARDAIVLDLGDIMRQGDSIKARAREAADRIIADARRERERLISDAAEKGRNDGHAVGLAEGKKAGEAAGRLQALAEFQTALSKLDSTWSAALIRFEQDRDRMLLEARQDVLKLAVAIGEMVTKRVILVQPDVVADQLSAVLVQLARSTRLTIRIHPDDRALIESALSGSARAASAAKHIELIDDPTLDRASVVASTAGGGEVDASIRTQLQRVTEALIPALPSAAGEPP